MKVNQARLSDIDTAGVLRGVKRSMLLREAEEVRKAARVRISLGQLAEGNALYRRADALIQRAQAA
jgi:hypothetical protein